MKSGIHFTLFSVLGLNTVLTVAGGGVPLPDHLVYGTIALAGQPVTKANTNVVVEARRPADGTLLASYRMGSAGRLGDFLYELRIRVEGAPSSSPRSAQLGETLNVSVLDSRGVLDQAVHQVNDAGVAFRLDFGVSVDANQNGIPDDWELAHLGSTTNSLDADVDGDGSPSLREYIAGTDPNDSKDVFRLVVTSVTNQLEVGFRARTSAGPGYEGRQRYYALETTADPATGRWQAVDDYSRIPGNDQTISYHPPANSTGPLFFRARVWLEGP
jgi:hypothetical protein